MSSLSIRRAISHFHNSLVLSAFTIAALLHLPSPSIATQDQKGAGVALSTEVSAKDIGLPLYPRSRRHKDKDNDSPVANLGLWGGGSGFKLAVLKMESDDSPEKIADFYKKTLAKYGKVLDCSHPPPAGAGATKKPPADQLTCADDKPDKGNMLFKAGTKDKNHLVAIQPSARGSVYQLIYLTHWDNDEKK